MLTLVSELFRNLNLQKQRRRVELVRRTRLFMLSRLLKIWTVAGAVERHLALLATALRADAAMDGGAEAFLLANLADGAAQTGSLLSNIMHRTRCGEDHERLVGPFSLPRGNPSGTRVSAISGWLPVNKHVMMPTSACNLSGTRVK